MRRLGFVALVLAVPAAFAAPASGRFVPVQEHPPFTVVGTLVLADMPPLNPTPPCPPKCMDPLTLGEAPPLDRFGLLFWPEDDDVKLETLSLMILDPANGQLVAQTEGACNQCGAGLPKQPNGGHLFRLDAQAIVSLGPVLKQYPSGLRVHAAGKGDYKLELVRLD